MDEEYIDTINNLRMRQRELDIGVDSAIVAEW